MNYVDIKSVEELIELLNEMNMENFNIHFVLFNESSKGPYTGMEPKEIRKYISTGELEWSYIDKHEIAVSTFSVSNLILSISLLILKHQLISIEYKDTIYRINSIAFKEFARDAITDSIDNKYENWRNVK